MAEITPLKTLLKEAIDIGDEDAASAILEKIEAAKSEAPIQSTRPEIEGAGYASATVAEAGQGASLSWADEIGAAGTTAALVAGDVFRDTPARPDGESVTDTYRRVKDSMRDKRDQFRAENPVIAPVANVAGSLLPIGGGISYSADKGGLKGVAGMTAVGGALSLLDYLGDIDQWSDFELTTALKRAGFGMAIPAMLSGGGGIKHFLQSRNKDDVAQMLNEVKDNARMSPDELKQAAKDLDPEASLVDITGDVGVGYGQGVSGVGSMDVAHTLEKNLSKADEAREAITDTLKEATNKTDNQYYSTLKELQDTRKAKAEELYGEALDKGSVLPTPRMLRIFDSNPTVKEAWQNVQATYEKNGLPLPKLFDTDDYTGKAIDMGSKFPNMRAAQELKWEMDKQLRILKSSADSTGKKEYARMKADYRDFMIDVNKQNPKFAKANREYAGDIALENAQELGKKDGLGRGNVEDKLATIKKLTAGEKDAYLQGVMSDVYSKLGAGGGDTVGNLSNLYSKNAQKVLTELVGKEATGKIVSKIRAQRRFRDVNQKIRGNSATQPREMATENLKKRLGHFNVEDARSNFTASSVLQKMVNILPNKFGRMEQSQLNELADLLTKAGGVDEAVKRMEKVGLNPYEINRTLKSLATVGLAGEKAAAPQQQGRDRFLQQQGLMQ